MSLMEAQPKESRNAARKGRKAGATKTRVPVRELFVPGKWSADADVVGNYVAKCARETKANFIRTTESKGMMHAIKLALGPDWDACIEGEFPMFMHKSLGEFGEGWLQKATNQFHGGEDWRNARCHWRFIKTKNGIRLMGAAHLSSAVESGGNWSGFAKGVRSHIQSTREIGQVIRKYEAKGMGVSFAADGNLDLFKKRWRTYFRIALGLTICWKGNRPKKGNGTHGDRLIDAIWMSWRKFRHARILSIKKPPAFDHDTVFAIYYL